MSEFIENHDLMESEDWKTMYLILFRAQTEVLIRLQDLSMNEIELILKNAMQRAEDYYINLSAPTPEEELQTLLRHA